MKNRITELLNIRYPVIQGGMAWISTSELAVAMYKAGGIGIIAAGNMSGSALRDEIKKARKLCPDKDFVFGVNLMLMAQNLDELIAVVVEERVPVVTTGAGNPGKYMKRLKESGIKVMPVVASVPLAKRVERAGADAIIVEGSEAGGHIGEISTMVLVPQVVDAVSIPVVAAGGMADGRSMTAAFALGAEAVQIGTLFIPTHECIAHDNYKFAIIKAKDRDTVVTGRSTGHPVRVIENRFSKQMIQMESEGCDSKTLDMLGRGKLRLAAREGDMDGGSVMAGQVAGMIDKIDSVENVMQKLMKECIDTVKKLQSVFE